MKHLNIEEFKTKYHYKTGFGLTRHYLNYLNDTIVPAINAIEQRLYKIESPLSNVEEFMGYSFDELQKAIYWCTQHGFDIKNDPKEIKKPWVDESVGSFTVDEAITGILQKYLELPDANFEQCVHEIIRLKCKHEYNFQGYCAKCGIKQV